MSIRSQIRRFFGQLSNRTLAERTQAPKKSDRQQLSCESLESRRLLSVNGPVVTQSDLDLEFVVSGSGGLDYAAAITFHNNHAYVASHLSAEVLRFDTDTGGFVDTFVPAGNGGLVRPAVVEFGPDGNLYVASNGDQGGAAGSDAIP